MNESGKTRVPLFWNESDETREPNIMNESKHLIVTVNAERITLSKRTNGCE